MSKAQTFRLTDLELHEVSCVDEPANQGARVLLFKHLDTGSSGKDGDQGGAGSGGAGDGSPPNATKHKDDTMTQTAPAAGMTEAQVTKMIGEAVAEAVGKARTEAQDAIKKATEDATAEVAKVRAEAEAANKRATDAEAMAATEKSAREIALLEKRVENEFPLLPGTTTLKAIALKAVLALPDDTQKALVAMLAAGNAAMKQATTERGFNPSGAEGSADLALKAKAADIQKAEPALSYAEAYDKAVQGNPDLYTKYLAERRAQAAA